MQKVVLCINTEYSHRKLVNRLRDNNIEYGESEEKGNLKYASFICSLWFNRCVDLHSQRVLFTKRRSITSRSKDFPFLETLISNVASEIVFENDGTLIIGTSGYFHINQM